MRNSSQVDDTFMGFATGLTGFSPGVIIFWAAKIVLQFGADIP